MVFRQPYMRGNPTEEQKRRRFIHEPTPVKVTEAVFSFEGSVLTIDCGSVRFQLVDHPYAAKLAREDNARLRLMAGGESHRIANFLERLKREIAP